jgi:hypothetical protein
MTFLQKLFKPYFCISMRADGSECTTKVPTENTRCGQCWHDLASPTTSTSNRVLLAREPNMPPDIEATLVQDPEDAVVAEIAKRDTIAPTNQKVFAIHTSPLVRRAFAQNKAASPSALLLMIRDEDVHVLDALITTNPHRAVLSKLREHPNPVAAQEATLAYNKIVEAQLRTPGPTDEQKTP